MKWGTSKDTTGAQAEFKGLAVRLRTCPDCPEAVSPLSGLRGTESDSRGH